MSSANPLVTSATTASPPAHMANGIASPSKSDPALTNGYSGHPHDTRPAPAPPIAAASKKGKQKKAMDSNEASKLVAARISQLELDAAGEKDQEVEIGASPYFGFYSAFWLSCLVDDNGDCSNPGSCGKEGKEAGTQTSCLGESSLPKALAPSGDSVTNSNSDELT